MTNPDVPTDGSLNADELSVLARIVGLFSDWARKNPDEFRSIVREGLGDDRSDGRHPGDLYTTSLASASG